MDFIISWQVTEAVARGCSTKRCSEKFRKTRRKTQSCTFIKKETLAQVCNFIKKETLAQVFSCEFCEISKNTFPYGTPPVALLKLMDFVRFR